MSRFLAYLRVSTTRQAEEGVSLDAQETKIRAWASYNGHEITVFREEGVSGTVAPEERGMLGTGLAMLDAGEYQGLVAIALDRISRSTRDVLNIVQRAEKHGWALVSLREALDSTSAIGRFVVTIFAALAQMERELTGERTAAALGQLKREKKRYSRFAPFGFRISDSDAQVLVADALEQEIAAFATETGGMAAMSQPAAARKLQERFGNHPRTGREWTATNVRNLFRSIDRATGE